MVRLTRFLLPSLVGAFIFLLPVHYDGGYTIPLGVVSKLFKAVAAGWLPGAITAIALISVMATAWYSILRTPEPASIRWYMLPFIASRRWFLLRLFGLVACASILWKIGPEIVWSRATGGTMLYDLGTEIVAIFLFASYLLPLLTEFGLMEFIGTLLAKVFRRLFTLPGRSCMDALASWMAAASVGVILTSQQYDRGYYNAREAACIATNFSIVSLPFCVIVAEFAGLGHLFVPYYLTICIAGFVSAMIMPRIPPLSLIADEYSAAGNQAPPEPELGDSLFRQGLDAAVSKAESAPGLRAFLRSGTSNLMEIIFGLLPPVVFVGTLGLVLVEHTPIFTFLSAPFAILLGWIDLPEATAAAPALLVGFVDMFLPAVIATGIKSELTRFVIIVISISQLVYLTEVGVLILRSGIPLGVGKLAVIFLMRTLLALPIAVGAAHIIGLA